MSDFLGSLASAVIALALVGLVIVSGSLCIAVAVEFGHAMSWALS